MAARTTNRKPASIFAPAGTLVTGKRGRKADTVFHSLMSDGIQAMGDSFSVPVTSGTNSNGNVEYRCDAYTDSNGKSITVSRAKASAWCKDNGRRLVNFGLDSSGRISIVTASVKK